VLSSLELEVITRYLERTGWSDAGQRRTHRIWARMLSDGIATVVVPNDRGYADCPGPHDRAADHARPGRRPRSPCWRR
jgi:hypothetical protein